jgi:hypothetical protein
MLNLAHISLFLYTDPKSGSVRFYDYLMEHDMTVEDFIRTNGLGASGLIETNNQGVSTSSVSDCRSCEHVENGSPSTAPPFWDSDGEDDDPGMQITLLLFTVMIITVIIQNDSARV